MDGFWSGSSSDGELTKPPAKAQECPTESPAAESDDLSEQLLMAERIEMILRQFEEEIRNAADDEEKVLGVLETMWGVLGQIVIDAVGLVDSGSVKRISDMNGRHTLIEVCSKTTGIAFQLYPNVNYCICSFYQENVIKQKSAFTCEHVLAARFADCMNALSEEKTPFIEGMLKRLRRFIPELY